MVYKIISHILRVLLGLVYIYSAYTKFYTIDEFELFIFGNGIPNWDIATSFARVLISAELFLGVLLLINIYTKKILQINLLVLILFTILLAYLSIFASDISNCNCFGEHLEFTPLESLLKNIVLIAITIFLLFYKFPFSFKFKKILMILILISAFSVPTILSPPDYIYPESYEKLDRPLDYSLLKDFNKNAKGKSVEKEKTLICFFGTHCKFCKLAAKKITIIEKNINLDFPIFYVFWGKEADLNQFWEETESKKYPYLFLPAADFFELSGNSLPSIYFVDKGIVRGQTCFRNLNQGEIEDFFKPVK